LQVKAMPSLAELTCNNLLTRKQYRNAQIRGWLFLSVWFGILIVGLFFWTTTKWLYKLIVVIILFVLMPSLDDIKDSLKSYEKYKKEWEEANKKWKQRSQT